MDLCLIVLDDDLRPYLLRYLCYRIVFTDHVTSTGHSRGLEPEGIKPFLLTMSYDRSSFEDLFFGSHLQRGWACESRDPGTTKGPLGVCRDWRRRPIIKK